MTILPLLYLSNFICLALRDHYAADSWKFELSLNSISAEISHSVQLPKVFSFDAPFLVGFHIAPDKIIIIIILLLSRFNDARKRIRLCSSIHTVGFLGTFCFDAQNVDVANLMLLRTWNYSHDTRVVRNQAREISKCHFGVCLTIATVALHSALKRDINVEYAARTLRRIYKETMIHIF